MTGEDRLRAVLPLVADQIKAQGEATQRHVDIQLAEVKQDLESSFRFLMERNDLQHRVIDGSKSNTKQFIAPPVDKVLMVAPPALISGGLGHPADSSSNAAAAALGQLFAFSPPQQQQQTGDIRTIERSSQGLGRARHCDGI
ncbi:hypothetical protein A4X13_0g7745 [Tilletia indica]|uniref:Uncharacterized protein n=1 Tax=Tilletia indica TaxID=43049 RepID=A0A177T3H0_9BASI|nr:hypothetical protein A4X13_0g7745 [Tilletia indica]